MYDDIYLRERLSEIENQLDSLSEPPEGSLSALVQTTTVGTYPTTASAFFGVHPLLVDGSETEGAAASFTPDPARTFYAFNLGSQTPPSGTKLIVSLCGGRWIFRYDGDGS
ncbi:MAG: hypothetical protein KGL39_27395 [Patescibacteria group bacterium]|nr:hypothetical protein [Patescibacteria group bacterium]